MKMLFKEKLLGNDWKQVEPDETRYENDKKKTLLNLYDDYLGITEKEDYLHPKRLGPDHLLNPFRWIKKNRSPLTRNIQPRNAFNVITHGDLHGENIFVEIGDENQINCWVFDFERTGFGPRFRDCVELEVDILINLLDLSLNDDHLIYKLILIFLLKYKRLPSTDLPPIPVGILRGSNLTTTEQVVKALNCIWEIRSQALEFVTENFPSIEPYYWGLLCDALYVCCITEDKRSEKYKKAFFLAAMVCHRLDNISLDEYQWEGNIENIVLPPQWIEG